MKKLLCVILCLAFLTGNVYTVVRASEEMGVKVSISLERDFNDEKSSESEAVIKLQGEEGTYTLSEGELEVICGEEGNAVLVAEFPCPAGEYTLDISKNGYVRFTGSVTVTDGISEVMVTLEAGDIKGSYDEVCGDGMVDLDDFIRILRGFTSDESEEADKFRACVDIDEDGAVTVADLNFVKIGIGKRWEAAEKVKNISIEKMCSLSAGRTVHPGESIDYTVTLENSGDVNKELTLFADIPENTNLCVNGEISDLRTASWNVTVPAGGKTEVKYTLMVEDDILLSESSYVDGGGVYIDGGKEASCHDIFIRRTFNQYDREKINTAIKALRVSEFSGVTLLKWIYQVAFTQSFTLTGTYSEILDQIYTYGDSETEDSSGSGEESGSVAVDLIKMTAPTLYGGKAVDVSKDALFAGVRTTNPTIEDFLDGDVILVQSDVSDKATANMYIYGEERLWKFEDMGLSVADTENVISALCENDRFIVLRPSIAMTGIYYYTEPTDVLNEAQTALVATAESYLLRGDKFQYDDSRFGAYTAGEGAEYRWQYGVNSPEDCTDDEWHYSNCAAFCYDVYRFGLGYDITYRSTDELIGSSGKAFYYAVTKEETPEEKAEVIQSFKETIQPGDIIVVKRFADNSGHAMFYCGNNTLIHSTGSSYSVSSSAETYEPTARYRSLDDITEEIPDSRNSIFGGLVSKVGIVRPLNKWNGEIPENSRNRVNNLKGIVAQKLSSHPSSTSANPGDEITYTLSAYNTNCESVTLEFTDVIPEYTTYVSGDFDVAENGLSKTVTIAPLETATVSYKVRVNADASENTLIVGTQGKIGGVSVNCPGIYVKRTLTVTEQQTLLAAVEANKNSTLTNFDLANKIYEDAFGIENIFAIDAGEAVSSLQADIFDYTYLGTDTSTAYYSVKTDNSTQLSKMVVPALYGGRRYYTESKFDYRRTRLAKDHNLVIGDIVLARSLSTDYVYIYNGEKLVRLNSARTESVTNKRFEAFLAYGRYYVVLRPSFVME